jgi:hypothetical protein
VRRCAACALRNAAVDAASEGMVGRAIGSRGRASYCACVVRGATVPTAQPQLQLAVGRCWAAASHAHRRRFPGHGASQGIVALNTGRYVLHIVCVSHGPKIGSSGAAPLHAVML